MCFSKRVFGKFNLKKVRFLMETFLKTDNRKRVNICQLVCFVSAILFTTSADAITYVSSPIIVPSDTVIDGNYETFQAQGISTCGAIYFLHSVHNVVIENVIIDGNDLIGGIHVSGISSNITIRNCIFKNFDIAIETGEGWGTDIEQLHIENCIFEQCNCVINIQDPVSYMYISDCTITKCDKGIIMEAKGRGLGAINHVFVNNVKITEVGAIRYPIQWIGVQYFKLNNVSVIGRYLSCWLPNGEVDPNGGTADQFALYGCQDGVVSNCHSEGGGDYGFVAVYNPGPPADAQRILFIGNTAVKNTTDGFCAQGTDMILVNNFSSGNRAGIQISGVENVASQNICRDNKCYGIYLYEPAIDTVVTGNICSGNGRSNLVYDPNTTEVGHNITDD
jgi:parallel beta-helix repeat protein